MELVGVLSDSHDNIRKIDEAIAFLKEKGIDIIIHAGDIIAPFAFKKFKGFKVYAVYGNNDGEKLLLKRVAVDLGFILSEQPLIADINGYHVAVIHGVNTAAATRSIAYSLARSGDFDVVVYGHLHETEVRRVGDTLVLNPGELCGYLTGKATLALVDLEERKAEIELI